MPTNNFNVTGFLKTIEQSQAAAAARANFNNVNGAEKLETIYLSRPENHGRYQIFPMVNTSTGVPFVSLPRTREIKIPQTFNKKDGTTMTFDSYVKILPANAYDVMDATGRVTSGLTSTEAQLLDTVQRAFDQLWVALGGNNREDRNKNKTIGYMRRRDYTLFHAKCLQKWGLANPRQAERTDFSALFVCTAKGFMRELGESITATTLDNGNDETWLDQVYSRDLTGRTGYLTFNISMPENVVGYRVTVDHKINTQQFANVTISQEDADRMQDPVEGFLGWQAGKDKLFNEELMKEVLDVINSKLAAVRAAGIESFGAPRTASSAAPGYSEPQTRSLDPMLQGVQGGYSAAPESAHQDPIPETPQWSTPSFAAGSDNPWNK